MISNTATHNKYPLMTILNINNIKYIVKFTHEGTQFELIDFIQKSVYTCWLYKVLLYNSVISKNTFTSLNFYNNSNEVSRKADAHPEGCAFSRYCAIFASLRQSSSRAVGISSQ